MENSHFPKHYKDLPIIRFNGAYTSPIMKDSVAVVYGIIVFLYTFSILHGSYKLETPSEYFGWQSLRYFFSDGINQLQYFIPAWLIWIGAVFGLFLTSSSRRADRGRVISISSICILSLFVWHVFYYGDFISKFFEGAIEYWVLIVLFTCTIFLSIKNEDNKVVVQ